MSQFIKDNWFKLSIAVAVLFIGVSVGYYLVFFIPNNEKSKVERADYKEQQKIQEQQEREFQQEQKARTNATLLQQCLSNAVKAYNENWKTNCIDVAQKTEKANTDWNKKCLSDRQINYNDCLARYGAVLGTSSCQEFLKIGNCDATFGTVDYSADCSLPKTRADSLDEQLKDAKNECYKLYPQ